MRTTHAVDLLLSKLPPHARMAHSLPGLTNNLLSVPVLCDAGCEVFFNATGCEVTLNGDVILRGWRDPRHRLWRVRIVDDGWTTNLKVAVDPDTPSPPAATANSLYDCDNTQQLTRFYHACLFSPAKSTLLKAINRGYLKGFPGLTSARVSRHITINDATEKGHMDQTRQGQRPTSRSNPSIVLINTNDDTEDECVAPPSAIHNSHLVFMTLADTAGRIFTDQTGRFPVTSNRGNAYLVIFYVYDANFIASVPIKNRTKEELLRAYQITYNYLTARGFKPRLHKMDNETSHDVEAFVASQNTNLQYTPPDMHRTNSAERAIRTWKNHFSAGLAGLPTSFPIANWCRLTNQCDYTINMLRPCRQNPLLSAFEAMEGSFSFDATPMAPPGTEVLIHLKPTRRKSWAFHASNGWYIGPSLKHYRCIRALMEGTGGERLSDTFRFKHHAMPVPMITPTDRIVAATKALTAAISGVQESPPDELQAIATLRLLLLGETAPTPAPIDPPAAAHTPAPALDTGDEVPVHIWDPSTPRLPSSGPPTPHAGTSSYGPAGSSPAIIDSDDDDPRSDTHLAVPTISHQNRTVHFTRSMARRTRSNHLHLINSAIAETLLPHSTVPTPTTFPPPGYIGAARALLVRSYGIQSSTPTTSTDNCFIGAIIDDVTGDVLEYRHLIQHAKYRDVWRHSFANELGRLFQGIRDIKGTNTCFFIKKSLMPTNKRATYGRIVCTYRPQKDEPHRTRLTVGGDRIDYPGDKSTPTADLVTAKLLVNSTISTPNARFYGMDLANFYLNTPLPNPEYMRLRLDLLPDEIIDKYDLRSLTDENGWVYVEIRMGMYGLPQAGILANKLLEQRLNARGYYQCQHTPGLWRHVWRDIMFCLVVDDFGVKTTARDHVEHLKATLEEYYTVAMDWDGTLFCGINIDWNYPERTVTLTMPKYIPKALQKFQHPTPTSPQHQPYKHVPIHYGARVQRVDVDTSEPLSKDNIKRVQDIVGTLLYYGRAVDPTLLTALSSIAARQSKGTVAVAEACQQLLDYVATHPNAGIRYKACDMILAVHTDASYLSEQGGKSRASAHFYLTNDGDEDFNNGAILNLASIIKHVMSSASEAELAALYYGCKLAVPLRTTLEEMGHPQTKRTMVTTDNITAQGLTMGTMTPKASKSMDQRFHWLKCRDAQRQFTYLWRRGSLNRADYASKHHPAQHHKAVRPFYVVDTLTRQ